MAVFNFEHNIPLPSIALDPFFNSEVSSKNKDSRSTFSDIGDLEQVMKDKASQEDESRRLDEEQERLHLRAKVLCGMILIQGMKKRNSEKRQVISQLQAKISSLEAELSSL